MKRAYIYIGVAIIVIVVAVILFFSLKKDDPADDYNNDINDDNLSYSDSEYQTFADVLWQSLHPLNEDEDAIYSILRKLKTKSDWNKLVSVYGTDASGYRLVEHLKSDLDSSEYGKCRTILSQIGVII